MLRKIAALFLLFPLLTWSQSSPFDLQASSVHLPVNSTSESMKVRELATSLLHTQGTDYIPPKSDLAPYFLSAITFENQNKRFEHAFQLKIALFYWYTINGADKKAVELGSEVEILSKQYELEDEKYFVQSLFALYKKLELYENMLELIPELHRMNALYGGVRNPNYSIEFDIATIQYSIGNYREAIKGYLFQADVFGKKGDQLFRASMYNNVGLCYRSLNEPKNAKKYFNIALEELRKPSELIGEIKEPVYLLYFEDIIRANLAELGIEEGNYSAAIAGYKKELSWKGKVDEKGTYINAYFNLANTYYLMGEYRQALDYLDSVFIDVGRVQTTKTQIKVLELRGKIALAQNDQQAADRYFSRKTEMSDSLMQLAINRRHLLATARFNTQEKEKQISLLQQEVSVSERIKRYQLIAIVLIATILVLLTYFYVRIVKHRKQLSKQKSLLESSLAEKEVLLKEVHHRVKNNLQVVSGILQLQSIKLTDHSAQHVFEESQRHIQSMALVHQMLYQDDQNSVINVHDYIEQLVVASLESNSAAQIETSIAIHTNEDLHLDKVIPLGLIISELITNSLKHAFPESKGKIELSLQKNVGGQLEFRYMDNGPGFLETALSGQPTMGLKLVRMLAEEMQGTITITGNNHFQCLLTFP